MKELNFIHFLDKASRGHKFDNWLQVLAFIDNAMLKPEIVHNIAEEAAEAYATYRVTIVEIINNNNKVTDGEENKISYR